MAWTIFGQVLALMIAAAILTTSVVRGYWDAKTMHEKAVRNNMVD